MFTVTFSSNQWLFDDYKTAISVARLIYNRFNVPVMVDYMAKRNLKINIGSLNRKDVSYRSYSSPYKYGTDYAGGNPDDRYLKPSKRFRLVKCCRPSKIKGRKKCRNKNIDFAKLQQRAAFELPLFDE
jgi:hypothetical protein